MNAGWPTQREYGRKSLDQEILTRPTSPLFSFRDQHEILRGLQIQLEAPLVADHHCLFATAFAHALIRCASQDALNARKIRGQLLAPGCLPDFLVRRCTGACSLSACSVVALGTGSSSKNCSCACDSFSPPAPYFSIRINRRRSSRTRIRSSAYCSLLFS
jgi:hypothetical protein